MNSTDAPTWYVINSVNQAANVTRRQRLHGRFTTSGANSCYVFTDRGTFDFLVGRGHHHGRARAWSPNLKIVTRDNSASAPGGANELTNYFHVYIINPIVAAMRR